MSVAHFIIYMCAALCLLPGAASANSAGREKVALPQAAPLTADCVAEAARVSDLPLAALIGILATENGRTGEALQNNNGTWDMGPFQINTCHVNELLQAGMAPEVILQDGCANAYAAAFILRKEYDRTRNIWDAVGAYHSRTPHLRDAYLGRVRKHLARMEHAGLDGLLAKAGGAR